MTKADERKAIVLETMRRIGHPIWVGDVASSASEVTLFRATFRALAEEGQIVRLPPGLKGAARAYYWLSKRYGQRPVAVSHPSAKAIP